MQCKVKVEVVKAKQRPYEDLCDRMDVEEGEKAFQKLVDECPEKKSYGGWSMQHRIGVCKRVDDFTSYSHHSTRKSVEKI